MSVIKVPRSFRLDKSVDDSITELMRIENRSRSNLVDTLLEEALRNRAKPRKRQRPEPRGSVLEY